MKLYQQLEVSKSPSVSHKVVGFFRGGDNEVKERDYFLTITSDGLLKTNSHLLESRI